MLQRIVAGFLAASRYLALSYGIPLT